MRTILTVLLAAGLYSGAANANQDMNIELTKCDQAQSPRQVQEVLNYWTAYVMGAERKLGSEQARWMTMNSASRCMTILQRKSINSSRQRMATRKLISRIARVRTTINYSLEKYKADAEAAYDAATQQRIQRSQQPQQAQETPAGA